MEAQLTQSVKNEVLRYIQSHLAGDLSLDTLSRKSGYSSSHLHRLLKTELEESLGAYIKRVRMETAAFLLSITRMPVSEIANWVGYANDAAFSRAFHQVMRLSPREFRKTSPFQPSPANFPVEYVSFDYEIVRLNEWSGLSFPGMFNYFDRNLFDCWRPAKDYLRKARIQYEGLQYWGVLYECPNISGNLHARIDAVVTAPEVSFDGLFNTRYPGGRYALFRLCAPHNMIQLITKNISAFIVHETTLELRESYSYLRYLDNPMTHDPDYLTTEWYIPIH